MSDELLKSYNKKYGLDLGCTAFFETGTHEGSSVNRALELKFENIYSCEIVKSLYDRAVSRFSNHSNVHLYYGDTVNVFPDMISDLNESKERAYFWIDAHMGDMSKAPVLKELEYIKELSDRKDHTITIDDMIPQFPWRDKLKDIVLSINPEYKTLFVDTVTKERVFIAYIGN